MAVRALHSIRKLFRTDSQLAEKLLSTATEEIDHSLLFDAVRPGHYEFRLQNLSMGVFGGHSPHTSVTIDVDQSRGQETVTAIHEMGHVLDAVFLNGPPGQLSTLGAFYSSDQASTGSGELQSWWTAVEGTARLRALGAMANDPDYSPGVRAFVRQYYLSPESSGPGALRNSSQARNGRRL